MIDFRPTLRHREPKRQQDFVRRLLVGICIPGFYDWSGAQQSRSSPVVAPIALGLLLVWVTACFFVAFLTRETSLVPTLRNDRLQFPMRAILILTTAIAVAAAVLLRNPSMVLSAGIFVCVRSESRQSAVARFGTHQLPDSAGSTMVLQT